MRPTAEVQEIALLVERDNLLALLFQFADDLLLEALILPFQPLLGLAGLDFLALAGAVTVLLAGASVLLPGRKGPDKKLETGNHLN